MHIFDYINFDFNDLNKEYLVIGDYSYRSIFLDLKKEKPLLNIKYYGINELISFLEFKVDDTLISYLIHNYEEELDYSAALKLAKLLVEVDENLSLPLSKLKKELIEKEVIKKDKYAPLIFKNKEILLFNCLRNEKGDFLDLTLFNLLKKHHVSYDFIEFDESKFKEDSLTDIKANKKIKVFKDKSDEFHYIFSAINKLINIDKVEPKKIYLYVKENDEFYFDIFSSLYNLKLDYEKERPLNTIKEVHNLLEEVYKNKVLNLEKIKEIEKVLHNYAPKEEDFLEIYHLEDLPFERAYLILKEIITNFCVKTKYNIDAINVINKPLFKEDIYLFITNFEYDNFYKFYDDNAFIEDEKLINYSITPSYNKTRINRELMKNFFLLSNAIMFSRHKIHQADKIYDSPFIKEFKLSAFVDEITYSIPLKDGLYTSKAKSLIETKVKDDKGLKRDETYKNYDYKFDKINLNKDTYQFSPSSISNYPQCPFKFYLDNYAKIDQFNDSYLARLGTFIHRCLELYLTKEDFATNFETYLKLTLEDKSLRFEENEKFLFFECTKKYLEKTFGYIKENLFSKELQGKPITEQTLIYEGDIDKKVYRFKGKFDLVINYLNNETYVIDFKTGSAKIHKELIDRGASLQVPLYAIMLKKTQPKYENDEEISCYIQSVTKGFGNSKQKEEKYKKNFELQGLSKEELFNRDGDNFYMRSLDVLDEILTSIIHDENFEISPKTFENDKSPCRYCGYKDVCFNKKPVLDLVSSLSDDEDNE